MTADRWSRIRLAVGGGLVALGVAFWVVTSVPAYGLVSGLGVVVAYAAAEPWFERWRNR